MASTPTSPVTIPDYTEFLRFFPEGHIPFVVPADTVQLLLSTFHLSPEQLLRSLQTYAKPKAVPPISSFYVGAAALGVSGKIYLGVNIEFAGATLAASIHGEQCALALMANHAEEGIVALSVSPLPCGHCRQFMQELNSSKELTLYINLEGNPTYRLQDLLPHNFGPADLGITTALLKSPPYHLSLEAEEKAEEVADALLKQGLEMASRSFSPYSDCPSSVTFQLKNGKVFSGLYIESAAYNPSLPPFQTATVEVVVHGHSLAEVETAVLIERADGKVNHRATTEAMVRLCSPTARFVVRHCRLVGEADHTTSS